MNKIWDFLKKHKNIILYGLLIALVLKVFIPQLDSMVESLQQLKDADETWVLLAIIVFFCGVPILAWQYMVLALKPIVFGLTLRVQFAGLFVSKLLPSSLGTLSLNMYYFVQEKHSVIQATAVMTANAVTSGIAYIILILGGLAFSDFNLDGVIDWSAVPWTIILFAFGAIVIGGYLIYRIPKIKARVNKIVKDLIDSLSDYKDDPKKLLLAVILNGAGSFTSLFALYASAVALGVDLTLPQALVAYTLGNIAAGLVPTPGGLGAAEVGIYSGLVIVGLDETDALNVMLLYRLISYWIPILPGYISFRSLRKNVLKKFTFNYKPNEQAT